MLPLLASFALINREQLLKLGLRCDACFFLTNVAAEVALVRGLQSRGRDAAYVRARGCCQRATA